MNLLNEMKTNLGVEEPKFVLVRNTNDIAKLIKDNHVQRGELFYDDITGDIYMVDKGDLELYWLKVGASKVEEDYDRDLNNILNQERKREKIADEFNKTGNINAVSEEELNPFLDDFYKNI